MTKYNNIPSINECISESAGNQICSRKYKCDIHSNDNTYSIIIHCL